MSTNLGTIVNDLKSSLRLATNNVLSYLLANLGLVLVLALLLGLIAVPMTMFAMAAYDMMDSGFGPMMFSWSMQNSWLVGGMGLGVMIPAVSIFLVVVGAIYGMTNDLVTTGETKAEAAFSYLRAKFIPFISAGAMLTIVIVVPQLVVWGIASYLLGSTVVGLPAQILAVFSFVWTFITVGLTSMVLPAVVSGKGVQEAFHESFRLATRRFDRVFGLLTAIVVLAAVMFAPAIIWGLTGSWMMNPSAMFLAPLLGLVAAWTMVAVLLWALLLYPMVIIAFVKVYHEITDGQVAPTRQADIPIA